MASYSPPTENLAIFEPSVFTSGDDPLTYNEAVKKFLKYPYAQGTENLQDTNINGLLTLNSDLDITQNSEIKWDNILNNYLINQRLPKLITTGGRNISLGHSALHDVNTGNDNIAIGFGAGEKINSGNDNICIGTNSGNAITTGIASIMIGERAGYKTNNTTCAIGRYALENLTSGQYNIAIGEGASRTMTSGGNTTSVGYNANQTGNGSNQTAIGAFSLVVSTGAGNTAVGSGAGQGLTTGNSNVMLGLSANYTGNTNLVNSCAIGSESNNANFSNSVALGHQSTNTSANQIRLGTASETVSCPGTLSFRMSDDNTSGTYFIPFSKVSAGTEGQLFIDSTTGPLTYNPSTATLSCAYTNLSQGIVNPDKTGNRYVWTDRTTRPTGTGVILIGYRAGNLLSSGDSSVMIGTDVGRQATSGNNNVYVGHQIAEGSNASGCTFIGYRSNQTNTSGSNCTALGANTSCSTFQNCTAIGQGATCTGNNQIRLGTASETVSCPNIVQSPRYDAPNATTLVDYAKTSTTANITIGEALTSGSILIGPQSAGTPSSNITIMPRGGWSGTMQVGGNSASAKLLCATNLEVNYPISTSITTAPTTIRQLGYTTTKTTGWTNITNTVSNINTFTIDGTVIAFGVYQVDLFINFNHGATAATTRISISNTTGTLQAPLKMTYSPASIDNGVFISETVSAYANTTFYIVADNSAVVTSTVITAGTDISTINLTRIA